MADNSRQPYARSIVSGTFAAMLQLADTAVREDDVSEAAFGILRTTLEATHAVAADLVQHLPEEAIL